MTYQDFSSDENFASSDDTIFFSFTCEDITFAMATSVLTNKIYKSYMPFFVIFRMHISAT